MLVVAPRMPGIDRWIQCSADGSVRWIYQHATPEFAAPVIAETHPSG
jgi:hypothetical protein